jgi:alpha-glucosidase (family GH31 glycosyl hydrolase)
VEHISADTVFALTVYAYGPNPADFTLYDDDGITDAYKTGAQNQIRLHWDAQGHTADHIGNYSGPTRLQIADWKTIGGS